MEILFIVFQQEKKINAQELWKKLEEVLHEAEVVIIEANGKETLRKWIFIKKGGETEYLGEEKENVEVKEILRRGRKESCFVFIDYLEVSEKINRLHLITKEDEIFICRNVEANSIEKNRINYIEKGRDMYECVQKSVLLLLNKSMVLLSGLRVKNKEGKKKSVESDIYLNNIFSSVPRHMSLLLEAEKGSVRVGVCTAYVLDRLVSRIILKSSSLVFEGGGVYMRISEEKNQVYVEIRKRIDSYNMMDMVQNHMRIECMNAFMQELGEIYGEEVETLSKYFMIPHRIDRSMLQVFNDLQRLKETWGSKKDRILFGIYQMLEAVSSDCLEEQSDLYSTILKFYIEERESHTGAKENAIRQTHLLPSKCVDCSSLSHILNSFSMKQYKQ
ncbi:hypothetical protein NEFER03_0472 [Nematocida sp. LUAm3]|nr:hypothetical protein NEFER03_0472 [Nematocida sp. LUAm3]KAI5175929.1 hypothetical protein NEFER02_1789 [Nematocida sp. LUAm2]KAI5178689.1 hypothetical protein NEFER01_1808 [Nematocida sp. LUAm1]